MPLIGNTVRRWGVGGGLSGFGFAANSDPFQCLDCVWALRKRRRNLRKKIKQGASLFTSHSLRFGFGFGSDGRVPPRPRRTPSAEKEIKCARRVDTNAGEKTLMCEGIGVAGGEVFGK